MKAAVVRPPRLLLLCSALLALPLPAGGEADPEAGRAVVVGGENAEVTPCFTCHGLDGVGDGTGAFPRLAGQVAFYLYKQLLDYAAGSRPNDIMTPIARQLSEQQMQDVAAYYAAKPAPYPPPPALDPAVFQRGRRISQEGLPESGLQACAYCHGVAGVGIAPSFPSLMGQYAPYTELQLRFWRRDIRRNDPLDVMRPIAKQLSEDDIRALARYFEAVRPELGAAPETAPHAALR